MFALAATDSVPARTMASQVQSEVDKQLHGLYGSILRFFKDKSAELRAVAASMAAILAAKRSKDEVWIICMIPSTFVSNGTAHRAYRIGFFEDEKWPSGIKDAIWIRDDATYASQTGEWLPLPDRGSDIPALPTHSHKLAGTDVDPSIRPDSFNSLVAIVDSVNEPPRHWVDG